MNIRHRRRSRSNRNNKIFTEKRLNKLIETTFHIIFLRLNSMLDVDARLDADSIKLIIGTAIFVTAGIIIGSTASAFAIKKISGNYDTYDGIIRILNYILRVITASGVLYTMNNTLIKNVDKDIIVGNKTFTNGLLFNQDDLTKFRKEYDIKDTRFNFNKWISKWMA